ncbi:hypothetical protein DSM104299_00237 [Baekduia alba]|nr:hypothetical protein DSM104299_00237 [Baekduia alba]
MPRCLWGSSSAGSWSESIADFEVADWFGQRGAKSRMAALVDDRIQSAER